MTECKIAPKRRNQWMSTFIDLTGQRFGRLIVQGHEGSRSWRCTCDCGTETVVRVDHLKGGLTRSCGCYSREAASKRHLRDLSGQRFHRLTVISRNETDSAAGAVRWNCRCDCGAATIASYGSLVYKFRPKKSCGCLKVERDNSQSHDLTGRQYGLLRAIERVGQKPPSWRCLCDCGNEKLVTSNDLREGEVKSCGCLGNGFNSNKPAVFYYLKVNSCHGDPLFKIGVTNRSVKERFAVGSVRYETLLEAKFAKGINAWKLEQALMKGFTEYLYEGPPVLKSGNSELFTKDILNLDAASNNPQENERKLNYANT